MLLDLQNRQTKHFLIFSPPLIFSGSIPAHSPSSTIGTLSSLGCEPTDGSWGSSADNLNLI